MVRSATTSLSSAFWSVAFQECNRFVQAFPVQQQPYAAHTNRDSGNDSDSIFIGGGRQGLVPLSQTGNGYAGSLILVGSSTGRGMSPSDPTHPRVDVLAE